MKSSKSRAVVLGVCGAVAAGMATLWANAEPAQTPAATQPPATAPAASTPAPAAESPAGPPAPSPEQQAAMMKAWMDFATPGPEHKALMERAGAWKATVEDFNMGGLKSQAKVTRKPIMDGRYLMEEFEGDMGGMPMQGLALVGFDNSTKEHFSIWLDNMGTGLTLAKGVKGNDPNLQETEGTMSGPMGTMKYRGVVKLEGPDKDVFEIHMSEAIMGGDPNKEYLAVRITYERVK